MKLLIAKGATSQIIHVFLKDSSVTTGAGKTALAFGDITAYYVRAGGVLTALTMVDITTLGTWDADVTSDKLGFKLLHDTNAPGMYEVHLPNNILATGADRVSIQLRATGMMPRDIELQLESFTAEVHKAKAALVNKQTQAVKTLPGTIVIYDDDNTTVLITLTPSTDADDPNYRVLTPS